MSHRTASQRSTTSSSSSSRVANGSGSGPTSAGTSGRKRATSKGHAAQDGMPGEVPRKKKARTEKQQQPPSFKPIPIRDPAESSPDELVNIPPPPSTRKIARLRESMSAERASVQTPAPSRAGRPMRYGSGSGSESDDDPNATRVQSLFTPKPPRDIPYLLFKPIARPRPSAAPPPSPGAPMGPPPTLPRRARKSRLGEAIFDSVVPLPITDTPVIRKNRELRKDAERRSSLGMRGQRASSSFGRGDPSHPHSSVPSTSFYKHLPIDQPEPIKARWLISWCAKRALDEQLANSSKGKAKAEQSEEIDRLLSDVVEDFVSNVAKGNVDTNVFGERTAASSAITVRPHPRNVENRATLDKEEAIIKRMRAEDRDWNRIAAKTNDLQALTLEATSLMRDARPPPDMNEASDSFQRLLQLSDRAVTVSSGDIGSAGNFGEVEFEVDLLHQTSHQANQYMHQAQRFLDGIFSSLAADLRSRDGQGDSLPPLDDSDGPDTAALLASAAAGPSRATSNPMNMLRALASADSQQQSAEAVAKAAAVSVAPTASSTRTQAMTPRRTATTATPRRQSVYGRGTSTPGRR